jgi:hypothetical protein
MALNFSSFLRLRGRIIFSLCIYLIFYLHHLVPHNAENIHNFQPKTSTNFILRYLHCTRSIILSIYVSVNPHISSSRADKYARKNTVHFLIYIPQDATLHSLFYLETALHVSGGTTTHHQERKQLYLQHLVFVRPLLLPAAIVAGISNGVTNTRCCRYSCLRS